MSEERVEYCAGECDSQVDKARRMYEALKGMREEYMDIWQYRVKSIESISTLGVSDLQSQLVKSANAIANKVEALSWAMVLAQNALAESEGDILYKDNKCFVSGRSIIEIGE